jgi:hypothetical protein
LKIANPKIHFNKVKRSYSLSKYENNDHGLVKRSPNQDSSKTLPTNPFEIPDKIREKISYALIGYIFLFVTISIVYLLIFYNFFTIKSHKKSLSRNSSSLRRSSRKSRDSFKRSIRVSKSDHGYSDTGSISRSAGGGGHRSSSHRRSDAYGTSSDGATRRRASSVDNSRIIENLKKRPSKSILATNRNSMTRASGNSSMYRASDVSSKNPSVYGGSSIDTSNYDIDMDRRSAASIKSVTFNEKTQVRRIRKNFK